MLSMSKLRIIPRILGRVIKPGTFSSNAKVWTYLDGTAPILNIPVIKTFEHLKGDWKANPASSAGLVSLASEVDHEHGDDPENKSQGDDPVNESQGDDPENES